AARGAAGGRSIHVIDCRSLDLSVGIDASAAQLAGAHKQLLAQALALSHAAAAEPGAIAGILFVTGGAQSADPSASLAQAPLQGFARTLRLEHPELRVATIDLDPQDAAAAEALANLLSAGDLAAENELAWQGGAWHVPRLMRRESSTRAKGEAARLE